MIIDSHTHLGNSIFRVSLKQEELLSKMEECGIDKAVICPMKPFNYELSLQNSFIAKIVQKYPEKFIGMARIDPRLGNQVLFEMERCIKILNLKGLYLNPWEENFQINSEIVYPVMEKAIELKIPVMIAGGYFQVSHPLQIAELASLFPQVKLIITSGGQINISGALLEEAKILFKEFENTILETSGIYRQDWIEDMIETIGENRIVFGSNLPYYDINLEIERIKILEIDEEKKAKILGENIAGLLKIK